MKGTNVDELCKKKKCGLLLVVFMARVVKKHL
jgi:hypothetical protein